MRTLFAATALALTLSACSGASIDEAYGLPDPFEWTYFRGEAADVVAAIDDSFNQSGIRVESIRNEAEGVVLTISSGTGRADFSQILVQPTNVEEYSARAQIYPQRDPLPRWLEAQVSGRI
jgi:ABC-type glycerol-3-phosphate transport system substrate-binding protein